MWRTLIDLWAQRLRLITGKTIAPRLLFAYQNRLRMLVFVACCNSGAWAATAASMDLTTLPWVQFALGAAVAFFGGVLQIAIRGIDEIRMNQARVRNGEPVMHPAPLWPVAAWDLLVSTLSGAGFVAIGLWSNRGTFEMVVLLFLVGLLGAKSWEPLSRLFPYMLGELAKRAAPDDGKTEGR